MTWSWRTTTSTCLGLVEGVTRYVLLATRDLVSGTSVASGLVRWTPGEKGRQLIYTLTKSPT